MTDLQSYHNRRKLITDQYELESALLSASILDCEVTLHRQRYTGKIWRITICHNRSGISPIGDGINGTLVGRQRLIYGLVPTEATLVEATLNGTKQITVQMTPEVFLVVVPISQPITVIFKNREGHIVQEQHVLAWQSASWFTRILLRLQELGISSRRKRMVSYSSQATNGTHHKRHP